MTSFQPQPTAIRVLIVDDEPHARNLLRFMLGRIDGVNVVGEAEDGVSAVSLLKATNVDVVFLDVQMPEMNGFDVIDAIGPARMPAIVFVTAFDRFAVRAFEIHALDYVLKPYDDARIAAAVAHAMAHLRGSTPNQSAEQLLSMLDQIRARREYPERIAVRGDDRVQLLELGDVGWIEADDKMLHVHLGRQRYSTRGSMRALEGQLDPAVFVRVHRSIMVNAGHVREVQPWFQGAHVIVLRDGTKVTSGRTYRENVLTMLRGPGIVDGVGGSRRDG